MEQMLLFIAHAAKMAGISPALLTAVCMTETGLRNVDSINDGPSTSYGVCQVKLETAHFMGKKLKKAYFSKLKYTDMRNPKTNILVAAFYLKYQIKRYNGNIRKAVAAYNAGSYRKGKGHQPFNVHYVKKVERNYSSQIVANYPINRE